MASRSARQEHARAYTAARESNVDVAVIQNKPYCPRLFVEDPQDATQIRRVVATLLQHCNNTNNQADCWDLTASDSWPVTPITGGITNLLFRVDLAGASRSSILVRLFGAVGLIDRDEETASFALLSESGMAPAYHGRFQNGRLEGWKHEMQALTVRQLSDPVIAKGIAQQMARLHAECLQEELALAPSPTLFTQLDDWAQQALQVSFQTDHDTDRAKLLSLPQYTSELVWLGQLIDSLPSPPAIAFCHNDLLAANILYNPNENHSSSTTTTIQLIDFEYGGVNYAAFDVANHWNEYAGGTAPGTLPNYDWLPSPHAEIDFVRAYLEQVQASRGGGDVNVTEEQVNELVQQVHLFQLINHVYWGLWAVNQAAAEGCQEFDYLLYATKRLERYQSTKGEWSKGDA